MLWHCWLGGRKGIRPVKKLEWWGAGVVICLERCADLHMAQLMPLSLTVSCSSKIQIGFTFLVPPRLGSPGQGPLNGCVCVCRRSHVSERILISLLWWHGYQNERSVLKCGGYGDWCPTDLAVLSWGHWPDDKRRRHAATEFLLPSNGVCETKSKSVTSCCRCFAICCVSPGISVVYLLIVVISWDFF